LDSLTIQVIKYQNFSENERMEVLALCSQAFKRDYSPILRSFQDTTHILGKYQGLLVTHALWVTRWLQVGTSPPMRTAYIEAVATELGFRSKGFASEIMKTLAGKIQDFDVGALSTGSSNFYARFGWQLWRGPLFMRTDNKLVPTPNEHGVMVLSLLGTPPLDLDAPLSVELRKGEVW
jgi:aminoglycoside 2'-N-acetyltransferase I